MTDHNTDKPITASPRRRAASHLAFNIAADMKHITDDQREHLRTELERIDRLPAAQERNAATVQLMIEVETWRGEALARLQDTAE